MSVIYIDPYRFGAGSGGGGGAGGTDYFAADGATVPFYGDATYPAAFYDADSDTSWFAWEGWDGSQRVVRVTTYDHTAKLWGAVYTISANTLTDDDHGNPAICMDDEGYVHCFFGAHAGSMQHSVTVAPRDPSQWRAAAPIVGTYTYPHPSLVGGVIYLFMRKGSGGTLPLVLYKTTALSGGSASWGTEQTVVTFGADSRFYSGAHLIDGTDIHIVATRADSADSVRQDIYHFIYDTTDGSVRNADGSTVVAAASLPIDLTAANAGFRVVDQVAPVDGDIPAACLDSNGDLHLAYIEGSASPYDIKHVTFTGGAWTSPVTVTTIEGPTGGFIEAIALVPLASGGLELWYPDDSASAFTHGGNMIRVLYSGTAWGSPSQILAADTKALARPTAVRDAHADARVIFTEIAQSSLDSAAGDLKMYAHGDGGLLARPFAAPSDIILSSTTVWEGASIGDVIGQLHAIDTDVGDSFTWTITADPDSKFQVTGNELELAAAVTFPGSHSVTIQATDSHGKTRSEMFTITVVENIEGRNDSYFADVGTLLDGERPGSGTDASFADVGLLLDGS